MTRCGRCLILSIGGILSAVCSSGLPSRILRPRGEGNLAPGIVKLLLDGQQRMTSLYGVVHGKAPKFFDGNAQAFTGLRFHLDPRHSPSTSP